MNNRIRIIILAVSILCSGRFMCVAEEPQPDAREILKAVRVAQSEQNWKFRGNLELRGKKTPFELTIAKGSVRYEFTDNGDVLTLRLGEKDSRLEEIKGGKTEKVGTAKFDEKIRDTDVTYEDLAMKFLYWPDAKVIGDDRIMTSDSWKLEIHPATKSETSFSKVVVWIAKEHGGLMKAESYGHDGRLVRRFIVRDVMKRDGAWFLKRMRIETIPPGKESDSTPTYLVLDDVVK